MEHFVKTDDPDTLGLPDLPIAHYRLTLAAEDELRLPAYKGNVLRGGFGHTFRRLVCFQRERQTCDGCLLRHACPYAYLFDPAPPPGAEVLSSHSDVPLGFLLEPPLESKPVYAPGERLEFGLTLVGRAIGYLPYCVLVFRQLGERGLGRGRSKYGLQTVTAIHPTTGQTARVYSAEDETVHDQNLSAGRAEVAAAAEVLPADRLAIEFLTPTRLKHGGHFVDLPEFHVLARALLRRVSSLSYFHGGERWEIDYRGWIERAKGVRLAANHTSWWDWERYSSRQGTRMKLGGIVGQATYEGEIGPFRPLLKLGELVHVGKACVFGNGMMRVGESEREELEGRGR